MAGFPFVTTILPFISSISYRAFALLIALLCLVIKRFKFQYYGTPSIFFIFVYFSMILHVSINTLPLISSELEASVSLLYLFMFGVTLTPFLAFWVGYKEIRWSLVFVYLFYSLLLIILVGLFTMQDIDAGIARVNLNDRQSTLVFSDLSALLLTISILLLIHNNEVFTNKQRLIQKGVYMLGIILALLGIAKAGSRGGLFSATFALLFIFSTLSRKQFLLLLLVVIFPLIFIGSNFFQIKEFAPLLYQRTLMTIQEGDMSGRDQLFEQGVSLIRDNPLLGNNSVLLFPDGSFTSYHNVYLDIFIELGVVFGVIYLLLISYLLFYVFRIRKKLSLVDLITCSIFIVFSVRGLTGIQLITDPNYGIITFSVCILVYKHRKLKRLYGNKKVHATAHKVFKKNYWRQEYI